MKKHSLPQFIGVLLSIIIIWFINNHFLVEPCIESSGLFNYAQGTCAHTNGDIETSAFGNYLIGFYFFIAILTALAVSQVIRKLFNIYPE